MVQKTSLGRRRTLLVVVLSSMMVLLASWPAPAARAQASELTGYAYGFFTSVSLFGGPFNDIGPIPLVTLPPEGSADPIVATDPDGERAVYGPAVIVETTGMTVSTQGTAGPDPSVTSTASVEFNENQEEQVDPFNADEVESTCTATGSEISGSTTLTNASIVTSTDADGEPVDTVDVPADPEPNTTLGGTIDHVGDTFRIVFNEQIREGDTITVNAVHMYLGQNEQGEPAEGVAKGEAIIGQSVCGIGASSAAPPGGGEATTTLDPGDTTTTTEPADTPTTTDEAEDESGGGGIALLVAAVVIGGGLLAALAAWLRRRSAGGGTG